MNDPDTHAVRRAQEEVLRAEIRHVEQHLAKIGADDDSAYEKARIRVYETLLQQRRQQLDGLAAASQSS